VSITQSPTDAPAGDRDERGRYLPGHRNPGPGRPRAIDLRALAEQMSEDEGLDLRAALWRVLKSLLREAERGDTQAARLVLDKLGDNDPLRVQVGHDDAISDVDLVARVRAILAAADPADAPVLALPQPAESS